MFGKCSERTNEQGAEGRREFTHALQTLACRGLAHPAPFVNADGDVHVAVQLEVEVEV